MSEAQEGRLLDVAHRATSAAAAELRVRFGQQAAGVRTKSSDTDLVSNADVAAEAAIRRVLLEERPQDAILGEEGGASAGSDAGAGADAEGLRWVVDPLDGTANFLLGIPLFAISVACEDHRGAVAGVVLDPIRDECFAATRSGPATLNGEPINAPTRHAGLDQAMVATGFAYEAAGRARQAEVLIRVLPRVRDIRRAGAAAVDLCWCACGRHDAYYERGVHAWDIAAGTLIARRSGLTVRELPADGADPAGVLVAPEHLADELFELVVG